MKNGKFTEFVDQLYYGQEVVFSYKEKRYFAQGWWNDEGTLATMVVEEMDGAPFSGYLWQHQSRKMSECAELFLTAPLWDGKTFEQIEADVTWDDWE